MKTKGFRFYVCILLICAIGLAVSIGTSVGNGKTPLSDDEMSSVYGGCGPCDTKDYDGCLGPTTNCEDKPDTEEGCRGTYRTTCKQEQKECKNTDGEPCDENHWDPCWDVRYTVYNCDLYLGECRNYFNYTNDCSGTRESCIGFWPGDD